MAGYLIANIDVKDPAKFEEYRQQVAPLIKKFGGRYLVRGGDVRRLEGNPPLNRLVVLEFPTVRSSSSGWPARDRTWCWRRAIRDRICRGGALRAGHFKFSPGLHAS
jgi:uncharacterized protein (DUF1330 family)